MPEDVSLPALTLDQTVPADKNIVVEYKPPVCALLRKAHRRHLRIIDRILVHKAVMELSAVPAAVPDIQARMRIRYRSVILADIIADDIIVPRTGTPVLKDTIACSLVAIGQ